MEPAGTTPAPQTASVRTNLAWLVLVCLLSGVIALAVVLYDSYRSQRAQLERNTIQTARALALAVDGNLIKAEAAARALATSGYLRSKDFAAFHRQASELLRQTEIGNNFVLSDGTGQQLVNTIRPFPGPLPRHGNPEQLRRIFETGKPLISDIYIGGVLKRPVMSIDVPVLQDGQVVYGLSVGIFPERLGEVLRAQRLPSDWVVSIFDTKGVIAARTHLPDRFVGQKGAPALLQRMAETGEGIFEAKTLEGIPVIAVFSRSAVTNWTVAIGIPAEDHMTELRRRFLLLAVTIAMFLALVIGLAWTISERIARSIRALTAPALALGSGAPVIVPRVRLREAAEVASAIGTAANLLARRTAELEAANKELEEFSYSISHDLNTPLRAIDGFAQLVEEEHAGQLDAEGRRLLGQVRRNTRRMALLIDSLLDYMRISRRKLAPVPVDLGGLAREIFDAAHAQVPERKLRLEVKELPPAWGDAALLRRVLENLVANAIKFTPPLTDGVIVLSGEVIGMETVYHFRDNGVGFDMRYADKLFHVFERAHSSGEFEGVGIGLAVIKRIVGRHGGRVWAEGKVGEGATIHFSLPRQP